MATALRRGSEAFRLRHPAQFVVSAFAVAIAIGTSLLMLPIATVDEGAAPPVVALFTATSAVCVTGLTVVETPTYWTTFGQVVVMLLFQFGGFGIMTVASLLSLLVFRRLGLRDRILASSENKALGLGDVRRVLLGVAVFSATVESVVAAALTLRFWLSYGYGLGEALYLGVFHAISSFNNAGFALFSDSLSRFAEDPWINATVMVPIVLGGIGFPVVLEIWRSRRTRRRWSLHTRLTLAMSGALLVVGMLAFLALEWSNPGTVGDLPGGGKSLAALFHSVSGRTAGFNTVDVGAMHETTWLVTQVLMFIGGGSASTAGGIKVTTFVVLAFVIWAEARGEPNVDAGDRRIPLGAQRQALAIALLSVAAVVLGTLVLMLTGPHDMGRASFEAVSAFGTTGLSTGITPQIPDAARITLVVLMFSGRLGPITIAAALALREKERRYRLPEERPIIG